MNSGEEKIFSELNERQRQAVQTVAGPVLIVAGAGSGKTKTLTHRVAHLLSQGVPASAIVTLTFTNKAADEMKQRITALLSEKEKLIVKIPFIGTFHKFALSILRSHARTIGHEQNFSIYDELDSCAATKQALERLDYQENARAIYKKISFLKNRGDTMGNGRLPKKLQTIYEEYEKILLEQNAFDFDNIILKAVELLEKHPEILNMYYGRYTHFLIDEYQDTNKPQYELLRLLAGKHNNICVVGDDWQSIYGFRSADYRILLNFEHDWPEARTFYLEQNYRSTQNILNASHGVISKNVARTEKKLFTENPSGSLVSVTQFVDEQHETLWIKEKIFSRLGEGINLPRIAILFRTNVQSRIFEDMCIQERIPYQLIGAFKFYKRKEIVDIVAYLRAIHNPKDGAALERIINVPPRGIGAASIARLKKEQWNSEKLTPSPSANRIQTFFTMMAQIRDKAQKLTTKGLIEHVVHTIEYKQYLDPNTDEGQERWENIQELMRIAETFSSTETSGLGEFLHALQLLQDADELDSSKEKLTLMTLHGAKGLEFDTVFISGLEEGLLPHNRSLSIPDQLEEERRLLYVGMTRAQTQLHLTLCQTRYIHGSLQYNIPSRFLQDIPPLYAEFVYQTGTPRTYAGEDGLLYEYQRDREDDEDIVLLG
ncbi:MAG: ATP-dependent DNA helicase PcrA [Parcubacteria group bacterium GW2011_GWF2_46_8]|nr:MAG: ATP-dependent DNA helicase PcrA [Parcubacteria group bacterium GW2011_GWF2_46_8]